MSGTESSSRPRLGLRLALFVLLAAALRYGVGDAVGLYTLTSSALENWQLLDPELLRTDLWQSLMALHIQPPLFNLIVGLSLKVFGSDHYSALIMFNCLMISATCIIGWRIGTDSGLSPAAAWIAPAIYFFSPASWMFQSYMHYAALTGLLVAGFARCVLAYLRTRTLDSLACSLIWYSLLALTRTPYHFVVVAFIIGLMAFEWWRQRPPPKFRIPIAVAIAILPLAFVIKNWVLFHHATMSTWGAMNVAGRAFVSREDPRNLAELGAFKTPLRYVEFDARYECGAREHPALGNYWKLGTDNPNMNHCALIAVADDYAVLLREHIDWRCYANNVAGSAVRWSSNPDGYLIFEDSNRDRIRLYADVFNLMAYGSMSGLSRWASSRGINPWEIFRVRIFLIVALVGTAWAVLRPGRRLKLAVDQRRTALVILGFAALHVGVHVPVDGVESDRFVFDLEILLQLVMVIFALSCRNALAAAPEPHQGVPAPITR